ncbi:peptidoglycan-binding domain-containing protein [Streptomyces roseolus]|uniref:peptidoglycan-binding domain-containing protein n=1 Tax=Streptomyces roseolus TaxID=67358 RepID=UPI00363448F4
MRSNKVKALASTAVLLAITAGTLAASGSAVAATPERRQTVVTGPASATEVVNLGLSTELAKRVQLVLADQWGYYGAIDGALGTQSWISMQRYLRVYGYSGALDGIVGTGTIKALQRALSAQSYYSGAIDGIAGPATRAAFAAFASDLPMD